MTPLDRIPQESISPPMHSSNNLSIRCAIPLHLSISKFLHSSTQSAFYICPISVWSYLHPSVSPFPPSFYSHSVHLTFIFSIILSLSSNSIFKLLLSDNALPARQRTRCVSVTSPLQTSRVTAALQLVLSADAVVTLRSPFTLSLRVMC